MARSDRFSSLVVLSFNRVTYLQRSLATLWSMTTQPYQLIIMDDASDRVTQQYVASLVIAGTVSSALLNAGHNMGIGIAMNRAMQISRGDIVCKLDSDLEYQPNWLEQVEALLQCHEEIGCLGLFKYMYDPCHFDKMLIADRGDYYEVEDFVGSAICMRREVYDLCGPWIEQCGSFSEDVEFKKAVQRAGYVLALTKEDLVYNFGFGEQHSSLIKEIDWKEGKHVYHVPDSSPRLFVRKEN